MTQRVDPYDVLAERERLAATAAGWVFTAMDANEVTQASLRVVSDSARLV